MVVSSKNGAHLNYAAYIGAVIWIIYNLQCFQAINLTQVDNLNALILCSFNIINVCLFPLYSM